jgi:hypothetical protein
VSILGFTFLIEPTEITPSIAGQMVALVRCDGWDRSLRYFASVARAGEPLIRRPGMLRPNRLEDELRSLLLARTRVVTMSTSARSDATYAECWFETQPEEWRPRLHAFGKRPLGSDTTWQRWVDAVVRFADGVPATTGAIFRCEVSTDFSKEAQILTSWSPGEPEHPQYPQWARMSAHREKVGELYVRFPRWGTLYSHRHVAALGGTARIVEVVRPAVVRELAGGVYFQLTDSIGSMSSQEAVEKERAFEELAAPLLPPEEIA